ncbi:quinone-dependent dihydroorotate dehydrogenase [Gymnodinialimonas sp. 2305UL16-5]|uniref:quinone-dependent dihydroorotate dehydrogenase n=1 Tax=Gymnodinialimonas mytili TaxID=3126503 RepID=UPI0030968D95
MLETLGLTLLRKLPPETAHTAALTALRAGLAPLPGVVTSSRLKTRIGGIDLPNPVGLAAGFDKNAVAIAPLQRAGFGFIEVGAATPRPQPGNPKPRLFRLEEDRAAINRFGFNNDGVAAIAERLAKAPRAIPTGLNLGANKDSTDRIADFAAVYQTCAAHIDFATINVSSPNTEKLRDLQGPAALAEIISQIDAVRQAQQSPTALFLKIAPDLSDADLAAITEVVMAVPDRIQAIIATNTTLDRDGLHSAQANERGGLSGQPLFEKSTRILAKLYQMTDGTVPLIGVGGVSSADQAYAKIKAGASAVQLYTGLVYGGLSLAAEIAHGLDAQLERDGIGNVTQAVGIDVAGWL